MKYTAMHIQILDSNKMIARQLSNYLNDRFGGRVNISTYNEEEKFIVDLQKNSHAMILDYPLNGQDKSAQKGQEMFDKIRVGNPELTITLLSSNGEIEVAMEEMKNEARNYILKKEPHAPLFYNWMDKVVNPIKMNMVWPIRTIVTYPIRKMSYYYNVRDYIRMFLTAFISVGAAVVICFLITKIYK